MAVAVMAVMGNVETEDESEGKAVAVEDRDG